MPEKVKELDARLEVASLMRLPFRSMPLLPATKLPLVNVKLPFTVMALFSVTMPPPCMVKLFSRVDETGNSGPVPPEANADALIYTTL